MWEYRVIQSKTMRNSSIVGAFAKAISEVSNDWVVRSTKLSDEVLQKDTASGDRGMVAAKKSKAVRRRKPR